MRVEGLDLDLKTLPGPLPIRHGSCGAADWRRAAEAMAGAGGRLVSLWGSDRRGSDAGSLTVSAAYATGDGLLWLDLPLAAENPEYPDLADLFPFAGRLQRAAADLLGIVAANAADRRRWLNHGTWPADYFPLRREARGDETFPDCAGTDYPFVQVAGEGAHEIAVGPVHAGLIEPGHFRFSVVGEKVLRLEERLGYTHKGVDKRFERLPAGEGHRLAGRLSGDTTLAFAAAYCMALESIAGATLSPRAQWLRVLLLERERVANHLGDLGALANDAAFAFGLAQFSRLKEDYLRLNKALFGHRLMMDRIVPGGVAVDLENTAKNELLAECRMLDREVRKLQAIFADHAGLQDRLIATGRVAPRLAAELGLTGLAGRASGLAIDLRADFPRGPYEALGFAMATERNGDVAARVNVRFAETLESLRQIARLVEALPGGELLTPPTLPGQASRGAGWVEGWRGEVFVALETAGEAILRCHCHDPSWQNWPAAEHAIMGNIVADFPLINKSFNLSYSGHDR